MRFYKILIFNEITYYNSFTLIYIFIKNYTWCITKIKRKEKCKAKIELTVLSLERVNLSFLSVTYSKLSQASKTELFGKIVNGF